MKITTNRVFIALPVLLLSVMACVCSGAPNPNETDPLWVVPEFDFGGWSDSANGIFYVLRADNQLLAWDEMTGATLWQIEAEQARLSTDKSLLYAGASDQCIAYNSTSGEVVETLSSARSYLCDTSRRDDSSFNFTVAEDQTLTATNAETGDTLWQTNLGLDLNSVFLQPPAQDPFLYNDQVIVYTTGYKLGDSNKSYLNFQVFDPQTGETVWQLIDKPYGEARISGDLVILIYSETGENVPNDANSIPTPVGTFELVARDVRTGEEKWHTTTDYSVNIYLADNIVYECIDDRIFRWWDMNDGTLLGEKDLSASTQSCPNGSTENLNIGDDIWLTTGYRTSPEAGLSFNGPYDGWVTAWQISTAKVDWSSEISEKSMVSISARGEKVVLVGWQGGYQAYLIDKP
jgi:outer membrane protein assembly factor BamB